MSDVTKINGYKIKDEKAIRSYETVALMKADTKLKEGYHIKTKGYYEANDGGHGEYIIVDDDTLVSDDGSIHTLDNGLRAKLILDKNSINVMQFGAKGDGENDDTTFIQNAINQNVGTITFPKGIYLIKNQLVIKDHNYIGNNAEIWIDNSTENIEYKIYNENFEDDENKNSFTFSGINFKYSVGGTGSNYLMSFKNIENVIFDNCRFYTDDNFNKTTHLLDLRCNSENVTIKNCQFYINEENSSTRATTILIRNYQGDETSYTNNIVVDNCILTKNCQDETVWVNADCGHVNNVIVKNCNINDIGNATNSIWFGATESGTITNSRLDNCKIYKEYLKSRLVTLGYQINEVDTPTIKNVSINDCEININDTDDTIYTYVILSDYDVCENISANNTKIKYSGTKKLASCFWNIDSVKNCEVDISNNTDDCVFLNVNNVYGGKYKCSGNITNTTINIYGATLDSKQVIFVPASSTGTRNLNLVNCNIATTGKTVVMSYNTSVINVIFRNCIIRNSSGISDFYSVSNSTDSKISLIDTDISNVELIYSNIPQLILSNVTYNGDVLRGVPTQANTRSACIIGTMLPTLTNDTTHTFVKKVSDGDTTGNWTAI